MKVSDSVQNRFITDNVSSIFEREGINLPKEEKRKIGPVYRIFSQDLYSTNLHREEMGYRQAEIWRAKSRQFSKDAEIIGKIEEARLKKGEKRLPSLEKVGFIIVRNSLWELEKNELARRFIVKLFSNAGGWLATIEEMVAEEVASSYAVKSLLLSFSVMTKDNEFITRIRQANRCGLEKEAFTFYMLGPDKTFEVFKIEAKRVSAGLDYRIVNLTEGHTVAEIDNKLGDIGGEFQVKIKDPVLAENDWFCRILQCFSIVVRYRKDMYKKLEKIMKARKKMNHEIHQHRHEVSLLANPRKLTLRIDEFEDL